MRERLSPRTRRVLFHLGFIALFVGVSLLLRERALLLTRWYNPDEVELLAQARAALRSPVPFTTWTTATTGPVWVHFLAALGALGFPLSLPFAHLVAAVLVGLMGYLGFLLLARRTSVGVPVAGVLTLLWYLPLVVGLGPFRLVAPNEFLHLSTELLPAVFLLGAAVIRTEVLRDRWWGYPLAGLLAGLAVGAKYQFAPLVAALLLIQLLRVLDRGWRAVLRATGLAAAGALAPFLVNGVAMLASPDVSTAALRLNLNFVRGYSGPNFAPQEGGAAGLDWRISSAEYLLARPQVLILTLVVVYFALRSTRSVAAARLGLFGAGLVATIAPGGPYGHYLYCLYVGFALAIGLELRRDTRLIDRLPGRIAPGVALGLALPLVWLGMYGPTVGGARPGGPGAVAFALTYQQDVRDPRLTAVCPPGSSVLVWGWAPELYVNYDWDNAIPFVNLFQIVAVPANHEPGYDLVAGSIDDGTTDCVVDAVGAPFFRFTPTESIVSVYPGLTSLLDAQYRRAFDVLDCEACSVYVRR